MWFLKLISIPPASSFSQAGHLQRGHHSLQSQSASTVWKVSHHPRKWPIFHSPSKSQPSPKRDNAWHGEVGVTWTLLTGFSLKTSGAYHSRWNGWGLQRTEPSFFYVPNRKVKNSNKNNQPIKKTTVLLPLQTQKHQESKLWYPSAATKFLEIQVN